MRDLRGINGQEIRFETRAARTIESCARLKLKVVNVPTLSEGFSDLKQWWDSRRFFGENPLHAFFLVTESDIEALNFIMDSCNDLDALSGYLCDIFLFYNGIALNVKNRRYIEKHGGKISRCSKAVAKRNARQAYIVADYFGIDYETLPCIIFFADLDADIRESVTFSLKRKETREIVDTLRRIFTLLRDKKETYGQYQQILAEIKENMEKIINLQKKMHKLEIPLHSAKLIRENVIGGYYAKDKENIVIKDGSKANERMCNYIIRLRADDPCWPELSTIRFILPPNAVKPFEPFLKQKEQEQQAEWDSLNENLRILKEKDKKLKEEFKKITTPLQILKDYARKQKRITILSSAQNVIKDIVATIIAKVITNTK